MSKCLGVVVRVCEAAEGLQEKPGREKARMNCGRKGKE